MLSVCEYITLLDKKPTHYSPSGLPAGSLVYLIKLNTLVDRFCYSLEKDAILARDNITICLEKSDRKEDLIKYNFYNDPEHCEHVADLNDGKEE